MGMGRGRGQAQQSLGLVGGGGGTSSESERQRGMVVTVKDTYGFIQPNNKGLKELFFTMKDVASYDEALHGRRGARTVSVP